jgi:hypothetical protein
VSSRVTVPDPQEAAPGPGSPVREALHSRRVRTGLLLAVVTAGAVAGATGDASGPQQAVTPEVALVAVAGGWIAWWSLWSRVRTHPVASLVGVLAGALLLLVASGLMFDVLGAFGAIPTADGRPAAPSVDWPGLLTRLAAAGAAGSLLAVVASARRGRVGACLDCGRPTCPPTPEAAARAATTAAVASLPYLLLKLYWTFGGTAGIASGEPLVLDSLAGWGTIALEFVGTIGCLGLTVLARRSGTIPAGVPGVGGRRVPRPLVLVPGALGAVLLLTTGAPGIVLYIGDLMAGTAGAELAIWVGPLVYGGWLAWGLLLSLALVLYQRLTHPGCDACLPRPTPGTTLDQALVA